MSQRRDWSKTDPIEYFEQHYKETITTMNQLENKDLGLYYILRKRKLLDTLLPSQYRDWNSYDPVKYFDQHYKGKIASRSELQKKDRGLCNALRRRKLLDKVLPSSHQNHRDWNCTDPIKYFEQHYKGKITSRNQLGKKDPVLYDVLRKRKLLDKVLADKHENYRDWNSTDPLKYFEKHYNGKITSRKQLKKKDQVLYDVLKERRLLDQILPSKNQDHRDWKTSDPVKYFHEHYKDKIGSKEQLKLADQSLYNVLRKSGKLDVIFHKKDERNILEDLLRDYVDDDKLGEVPA